jgi:ABC-type uncharacterized transport system substrate-binding protein
VSNRRQFVALLGGVAATWPLAADAQHGERMRRVGVLVAATSDDPEYETRMATFRQGLALLGLTDGRNVQIDTRWATTDAEQVRKQALELAAWAPDVILAASGTTTVAPLLQATRTVPIVSTVVIDPVGAGFVANLARPGGNATGFLLFEYGLSGKWLERLKQIAPGLKRVAVLRDPTIASGIGQFGAIQSAAPSLGLEAIPVNVREEGHIERDITTLARSPNGGIVVTSSPEASPHRHLIITLAAGTDCRRFTLTAPSPSRVA